MAVNVINNVCDYLKKLNFHYLDSWVVECIQYYQTNHPLISDNDLKEEVKQQWLLLNLRDLKVSVFPPNLKLTKKVVLTGKYAVQVETLIDSGQSRFSQLQSLFNYSCDNIKVTTKPQENELPSRRCLTMTITDGVQELNAMELEVIPALRLNDSDLLPGFKMVISGPVTCRKGMLLLTQMNVTLCGGEVDVLAENNNLKSLLMDTLGVEGSSKLRRDTRQDTSTDPVQLNDLFADISDDLLLDVPMETNTGCKVNQKIKNNPEVLLSARNCPVSPMNCVDVPEHMAMRQTELLGAYGSEENLLDVDNELRQGDSQPSKQPERSKLTATKVLMVSTKQTSLQQYFTATSINQDMMPNISLADESKLPNKSVSHEPYVYLCQLAHCIEDNVHKVKAVILTLKTKIFVNNDFFQLQAKICDGSLSMDVNFSSNVLEDMLGFSPTEMSAMVKEKNKNSAVGERLKTAFVTTQQKLISLNCLFHIQFFADKAMPLVISLEEISILHLRSMEARNLKK